ncbi:Phosphate regulon sensor protein PhoR (SphS) [hydrothermal vent metagenome]|uniref:histidine kinase n=1 Tax=hydrothermal vent metagenome TaxID=652676 RepID=A0A3B1CEW8_9ZZZZ
MFSSRLIWKIYASYAAVILLSSALLGGLVTNWMKQDSIFDVRNKLQSQAYMLKVIAEGAAEFNGQSLQKHITELGSKIESRFTLIDKDGAAIADSMENPAEMDNHGTRPEILAARSHGKGSSTRFSETLETKMMYFALPIYQNNNISGYARTSISLDKMDEKLSSLMGTVAMGAGIAVIAALILGYFMALHFTRPIESMTKVAEAMAQGKHDERLVEKRDDEIGKLARAFNKMASSLSERIATISGERNKLEAILAGMVEGVIAVGSDERIIHINKAACDITGVAQDDSIEKPLWETLNLQPLNTILENTLAGRSEVAEEIVLTGKKGNISIEVLAAPIFTAKGEISAVVIVLHDLTELYALERVRRDFIANVSHELKTPVTAIRALTETILDDENMTTEDQGRFLGKILKQAIRLSTLVSDVLTLARLESVKGVMDVANFDLRAIIHNIAHTVSSDCDSRAITLKYEAPDKPVVISGDKEAMLEAVGNLANNAIKYTPREGSVTLILKKADGKAVIEVKDTGIGIEPAHCSRIFERFYRVDKARSRELGGTGLGLSIVKHVALSHGGSVEVKSQPGLGSLFTITIPLAS